MLQTQPLEISDFSFGITDYYIDGLPLEAQSLDNLIITPNKKVRSRWGSTTVNNQLPLGVFRVNKFASLDEKLIVFQDKRAYRDNAGAWAEILGPSGGTFLTLGNSQSVIVDSEWQHQLFFASDAFSSIQKLYIDGVGAYQVRNAGLPGIETGFSVTNPTGSGSSYLYSFCIAYEYTVGSITYLDRGPVTLLSTPVVGGAIAGGNTTTVTIPGTYSPAENWDTANWKIEIYRTQSAGTVFFKVGEVNFGTTSFVDNVPDATLATRETLYTTGDVAENETPPKAKYVHVVNDYGYYAHIKDGSEILDTTVLQSKAGDPDSVPASFNAETEQEIKGLSSIYDRPIVLCRQYIYRIDNFFGDDGTGGMLLRRIDDKAGCISAQSLVQTHLGLFWAGELGFYWTDGFRVVCISDHLNQTYKTLVLNDTRKKNIVGTFDKSNHRVIWSVSLEEGSGEADRQFVLDIKSPFQPDGQKKGGTFTTFSGGDNFRPTQTIAIGKYVYRGDTRGYVFRHSEDMFTDPKINTAVAPSTWGTSAIIYDYKSCFLDFGGKFFRKWVPRILISADNTTNLSLGISSSNDNNRVTGVLAPIRYRKNITWGEDLPVWGDATALWNAQGLVEEWRHFPSGGLRCNYKQVQFYNAIVNIIDSTLLGTATVNITTKTATLGGSYNWLDDIVDYFIAFEHDGYVKEFQVTSATATTLIYADPLGAGPSADGVYNWVLRGRPKGEVLQLNGYVIHYAPISKSHTPFSSSSLGGS